MCPAARGPSGRKYVAWKYDQPPPLEWGSQKGSFECPGALGLGWYGVNRVKS